MKPIATITFRSGDLHAQVKQWADERGLIMAPGCYTGDQTNTRGMMPSANYSWIAKWRNLTQDEKDGCVAVVVFDDADGSATITQQHPFLAAVPALEA